MKKTISGVLLALASVCALAACGKDKETTKAPAGTTKPGQTTKTPDIDVKQVINFYCWNNEFQTRLRKYYPNYGKQLNAVADVLKDGTQIQWTMVANQNGSYQYALDEALKANQVDMFCFEADYADKYVNSSYVVDMATLSIDQSKQYKYTKDAVTNADGKIVGSSWQGCPGCICFNSTIGKAVWTDYSDDAMATRINTSKAEFDKIAAELEAKDTKYGMMIGYADWYRVYGNNLKAKMNSADGKSITVDDNLFQYAIDTQDYAKKGYLLGTDTTYGLWGTTWGSNMAADTNAFTIFACPWFTDFSLKDNCKVADGESSPWRVAAGYASWFWGGTWLTATPEGVKDAGKKAAIADIIKEMTTNKEVLLSLSKGELDFTNNQEAMETLAKDATANNAYFGGQNTYAIYAKSVLNADLSKAGKYDQFITENFQNCFLPFIQSAETGSEATACWTEFVKAVSKATGVDADKITYSANVSLTDDIAIGGSLSA